MVDPVNAAEGVPYAERHASLVNRLAEKSLLYTLGPALAHRVNFTAFRERFINYNCYSNYKEYNMKNTTIAISEDLRESIKEFGNKGETYSEILYRLIKSAKERQLHDLLMSEEDTVTIEEALSKAKKRWQK